MILNDQVDSMVNDKIILEMGILIIKYKIIFYINDF